MNDRRIPVPGGPEPSVNALTIALPTGVEVIRIAADGTLFWRGREVRADADFKSAMLDLAAAMGAVRRG